MHYKTAFYSAVRIRKESDQSSTPPVAVEPPRSSPEPPHTLTVSPPTPEAKPSMDYKLDGKVLPLICVVRIFFFSFSNLCYLSQHLFCLAFDLCYLPHTPSYTVSNSPT